MNTAFARILAVDGKEGTRGLAECGLEKFGLEQTGSRKRFFWIRAWPEWIAFL